MDVLCMCDDNVCACDTYFKLRSKGPTPPPFVLLLFFAWLWFFPFLSWWLFCGSVWLPCFCVACCLLLFRFVLFGGSSGVSMSSSVHCVRRLHMSAASAGCTRQPFSDVVICMLPNFRRWVRRRGKYTQLCSRIRTRGIWLALQAVRILMFQFLCFFMFMVSCMSTHIKLDGQVKPEQVCAWYFFRLECCTN